MAESRVTERPFLKEIIDDFIEEPQGARVLEGVLPRDTFGQTEAVKGKIEVTINNRFAEMSNVKDAYGVAYMTKWHESIHIEHDISPGISEGEPRQLGLPGIEGDIPRLIVCRGVKSGDREIAEREFIAENAAIAAAIAGPDLLRCEGFLEFRRLAAQGGDLGSYGWKLLYRTSEAIGVNITAVVRYFTHLGFIWVEDPNGRKRLIANRDLMGSINCP